MKISTIERRLARIQSQVLKRAAWNNDHALYSIHKDLKKLREKMRKKVKP